MRKSVCFILSICIFMTLWITPAYAGNERKSGLFTYELKGNGNAVITGFDWDSNGSEDVYIPRQIDGYNVTEIGANAFAESNINVVVVLPDTITTIGEKAFFNSGITAITLPNSVQVVGSGAFAGCNNLAQHSVASDNQTYATIDGVLYNKKSKELVSYPVGRNCSDFEIPDGIVSIGDYAFYGVDIEFNNPNNKFIISPSVKRIGAYAFANAIIKNYANNSCILSGVGITDIDNYAFYNSELDGWNFPQLETIGNYSFALAKDDSDEDTNFHFTSSLTYIGEGAFQGFILSKGEIDLSETNIKEIPSNAFKYITTYWGALSIHLPPTLETIGESAFAGIGIHGATYDPVYITLPASVMSIGQSAFEDARIRSFEIESDSRLLIIDSFAFLNAFTPRTDDTLVLPNDLMSLGEKALYTPYLSKVVIPPSVTSIGNDLCDRSITQLEVEEGSYAALYASENGYGTTAGEDTSWLNN